MLRTARSAAAEGADQPRDRSPQRRLSIETRSCRSNSGQRAIMGDGPSRASSPKYSDLPRRGSYSVPSASAWRDRGETVESGRLAMALPDLPTVRPSDAGSDKVRFDHAIERHLGAALLFQLLGASSRDTASPWKSRRIQPTTGPNRRILSTPHARDTCRCAEAVFNARSVTLDEERSHRGHRAGLRAAG
jgi:hypothetical protein